MEQVTKKKLDISTILINLLAIVFLTYITWIFCDKMQYFKVVAVISLMMPKFISIWRAFKKISKLTDLEQWIFIIIAIICWIIQSFLSGKLNSLLA